MGCWRAHLQAWSYTPKAPSCFQQVCQKGLVTHPKGATCNWQTCSERPGHMLQGPKVPPLMPGSTLLAATRHGGPGHDLDTAKKCIAKLSGTFSSWHSLSLCLALACPAPCMIMLKVHALVAAVALVCAYLHVGAQLHGDRAQRPPRVPVRYLHGLTISASQDVNRPLAY